MRLWREGIGCASEEIDGIVRSLYIAHEPGQMAQPIMPNATVLKSREDPGLLELGRRAIAIVASPQVESTRPIVLCDELLGWVDRRRWWLWSFVLLMYAAGFNGLWRIQPDAALYLSLGRNLAEGKGYTYLGEPHRLAYPGWPMVIAGVFKLFGSQSLLAVNAMTTVIALLTVGMVYRLFLLHNGRPTAVVVSVGVALTKAFYCYGFELWADMLFALAAMAFLAGYEGILTANQQVGPGPWKLRRRLVDSTLLISGLLLALVTRPTGWPLMLALACALPIDALRGRIRWPSVALLFAIAGIAAAFMLLGAAEYWRNYGLDMLNRLSDSQGTGIGKSILHNLESLLTWAASDVLFQVRLGDVVNSLLGIIVLSLGLGLFRYRSLWGFWFVLLLGTILISQTTLDRYFLPVLPLLVFAWWALLVRLNKKLPIRWSNLAFLGLLGFGMLMNFTKVCGIIAQQHTRPFLQHFDQGRFETTPEFSRQLMLHTGPDAVVLMGAPYGRVTAFLSRRNVKGAVGMLPLPAGHPPIYVVEPLDEATKSFLKATNLTEGPALFTVSAAAKSASTVKAMSLHATVPSFR